MTKWSIVRWWKVVCNFINSSNLFHMSTTIRSQTMKIKKQLTIKNRQGGAQDEHRDVKIVLIIFSFERMKWGEVKTLKLLNVFGHQPVRKNIQSRQKKEKIIIWLSFTLDERKKQKNVKLNHRCCVVAGSESPWRFLHVYVFAIRSIFDQLRDQDDWRWKLLIRFGLGLLILIHARFQESFHLRAASFDSPWTCVDLFCSAPRHHLQLRPIKFVQICLRIPQQD